MRTWYKHKWFGWRIEWMLPCWKRLHKKLYWPVLMLFIHAYRLTPVHNGANHLEWVMWHLKMNLWYFEASKAIIYKIVNKSDLISHNQDFLDATISGSFHRAQTIVYRAWDGKHVLLSLQNLVHVAVFELNINFLRICLAWFVGDSYCQA